MVLIKWFVVLVFFAKFLRVIDGSPCGREKDRKSEGYRKT